MLVAKWKGQMQHSAVENTAFKQFLLRGIFSILHT